MTRKSNLMLGLGLALSLAGTQAVVAQQSGAEGRRPDAGQQDGRGKGGRGERGMRGGRGQRGDGFLLRGITLTDAQKQQLQQLRESERAQMEQSREGARTTMEAARAARQRGDTAAARVEMQKVRAQMEQQRERHVVALRNILTSEQRTQLDRNVAEAKQRQAEREAKGEKGDRGDRGGRRGPGGEGKGDRAGFRRGA